MGKKGVYGMTYIDSQNSIMQRQTYILTTQISLLSIPYRIYCKDINLTVRRFVIPTHNPPPAPRSFLQISINIRSHL